MKSIIDCKSEQCFNCGANRNVGLHEHHIFYGPNRKNSEKYGLKVKLCYICHEDAKKGVHGLNKELRERLFRIGQEAFEREHTREEFMTIFGKNYLDAP